jgi:thiol-disulfide isomerase/thioredoxin
MKNIFRLLLLLSCLFCVEPVAGESDMIASGIKCAPEAVQQVDSGGICVDPVDIFAPSVTQRSLELLLTQPGGRMATPEAAQTGVNTDDTDGKIIVYFFWGKGCPHCEEEKMFLDELKRRQSSLEIRDYEVWNNRKNAAMMATMLQSRGEHSSGVPVTFVGERVFSGFSKQTGTLIAEAIARCQGLPCGDPAEIRIANLPAEQSADSLPVATNRRVDSDKGASVTIPLLGKLDAGDSSLPVLTLVIAGMDSFNPCAFFVLLTLLGLLIHAQSRNKMLLIGGIFVFFSGFFYFLFMAAWLNLFLVMGNVGVITSIAGIVSLGIAGINIKDFFLFKQGISLSIPDSAKPKLFERMRKLLRSTSLLSILLGATVLAVVANFYELLCTAGFPMVFTRILTLNNLSTTSYYLYLLLYNIIYVIPLLMIVLAFTLTLGKRQLSEWQGRVLKLVSGAMMLGLGVVLLVNPALLNSIAVSFAILVSALGFSLLVAAMTKRREGTAAQIS